MVQIKANPETEKVLEKQRAILLAASKLFRVKGFHSTGMRDIAASSGMTVGNLYYYFRHKEEILAFCQEETLDRLRHLVDGVRAEVGAAPQKLAALIAGHVRCLNEGIPGSLAHLEVPETFQAELKDKRDRYEEDLCQLIREGVAEGSFFPCDEKVAALAILGSVNWTVRWYRADGRRNVEDIGFAFALQLVRGLMTADAITKLKPETWGAPLASAQHSNEENDG